MSALLERRGGGAGWPRRRIAAWIAALGVAAAALPAGAADDFARLRGSVRDSYDQLIGGVKVTVLRAETGETVLEDVTDEHGAFSAVIDKPKGSYRIRLEAQGYLPWEGPVSVTPGELSDVSFRITDLETRKKEDAAAAYSAGAAAYKERDYETARKKFEESLELNPGLFEPHLALADILHRQADDERAARHIEEALSRKPDSQHAMMLAYEIYSNLGNQEKSDALVEKLKDDKELAPKIAARVYNDGVKALQAEDIDGALKSFRRALEIDPSMDKVRETSATVLYNAGRYDEAQEAIGEILQRDPGNKTAIKLRYLGYEAQGKTAQAEEAFKPFLDTDPEEAAKSLYRRGDREYRRGNVDGAIRIFERVVRLNPNLAPAHYALGVALAAMDPDKARKHLQRFLQLAPNDPEAKKARELLSYL